MKRFSISVGMRLALVIAILFSALSPHSLWACACGCGVFEVGTSSMFPTREGGMVFFEYDYQNQNRNWRGTSSSSADNNADKKIISNFFAVGAQYMFNRRWGVLTQIPYTNRYFKAADEDTGDIMDFTHSSIGDIRLRGIYTGWSEDMSTGLTFGLKLPTGSYKYEHFDPDVQIGSGSTDLLLGGYHMGMIAGLFHWNWFANADLDLPVIHYTGYIPGTEINAALGAYYHNWDLGPIKIAPTAKVLGTHRWSDAGELALSESTGYSRILLAPGLEFDAGQVSVYADVGFPVYQYTTGDQLVASQFFKLNVSYHF